MLFLVILPLTLFGVLISEMSIGTIDSTSSEEFILIGSPKLQRLIAIENEWGWEDMGPFVAVLWSKPDYSNTTLLGYNVFRNGEMIAEMHHLNPIDSPSNGYFDETPFLIEDIYEYYVTAVYTDAESEPSNILVYGAPIMGAPKNLTGTATFIEDHWIGLPLYEVNLKWDTPSYQFTVLMGYDVYRDGKHIRHVSYSNFSEWLFNEEYTTYTYHIVAVYATGNSEPSETIEIIVGNTSDTDEVNPFITKLGNNYPNPFNPSTTIYFDLPQAVDVTLEIFNLRGQVINTLANSSFEAGRHYFNWDGKDYNGVNVSSGVYFYKLQTDDFVDVKRMVLMK